MNDGESALSEQRELLTLEFTIEVGDSAEEVQAAEHKLDLITRYARKLGVGNPHQDRSPKD